MTSLIGLSATISKTEVWHYGRQHLGFVEPEQDRRAGEDMLIGSD